MFIACLIGATLAFSPSSCDKARSASAPEQRSSTYHHYSRGARPRATTPAPAVVPLAKPATLAPLPAPDELVSTDIPPRAPLTDAEKQFYRVMARSAWSYFTAHYDYSTGIVRGTPDWAYTTMWDVGGQLLATHAGKELGFINAADYDKRITKVLQTLEQMELFRGIVFNKVYSAADGSISKESRAGWSATDIGRFMLALKILAVREPQYATQIERIVRRMNMKEVLKNGYMYGQLMGSNGKPNTFQEGRIGYEQYAAEGFRQWGYDVGNAVNLKRNADKVKIMGVEILQDRRFNDRLLSEPFILYGIELGMTGEYLKLANNVLRLQEERFKKTGKMTIASEDAVAVPPMYFYYYCVYCSRKSFVIDVSEPGKERNSPRWVSTKGAFGWHALLPSDYTKRAMEHVAPSKDPTRGWASGIYEDTGKSTDTYDINTAAVLLEIALFQLRGAKPLMQAAEIQ